MELFFAPLSCSLASRIALYENGIDATFIQVARGTKRLPDGSDYHDVHPLGLVPALRTDEDELITENAVVLQYIAERGASLDAKARRKLQRWLSFIATELHKGIFATLFDAKAPEEAKRHAIEKGRSRLEYVDRHLTGRSFVLDAPSVVDAYLFTILNWTRAAPVELADYPALAAYYARIREYPSVARALAEELPLYQAEMARLEAAS